ncbi:hypothetical protein EON64_10350 [archaeon]|nr:MAG: hypothetical protein EON64_10350 [archaeon]
MSYYNNNWSKNRASEESMYASSGSALSDYQPTTYQRGGSRRESKKTNDSYDFDISQDDYSYSPAPQPARRGRDVTTYDSSASQKFTRRSSIDDRAKEILEKNRTHAPSANDQEVDYKTLQSTFAELLEGIDIPDKVKREDIDDSALNTKDSFMSMDSSPKIGKSKKYSSAGSLGSPDNDSLDISAADLEVGAFAAKKAKEKAAERRRRMSFDQPTYNSPSATGITSAKSTFSPEVKVSLCASSSYE